MTSHQQLQPPQQSHQQQRLAKTSLGAKVYNKQFDSLLQQALDAWKQQHQKDRNPPLKHIMAQLQLPSPDAALSIYGLPTTGCLKFALYGSCHQTCTRTHTPIPPANLAKAQTDINKALSHLS
jgi:hypothetical protein